MKSHRIITFVPADKADIFAKEIAEHIPHLFGEYDSVCWWGAPKIEHGIEQFRPLNGDIEQIPSVRMEFSVPDDETVVQKFTNILIERHPWKEPVILISANEIIEIDIKNKIMKN